MDAMIRVWKTLVQRAKLLLNSCIFMNLRQNQPIEPSWSQDTLYRQGSVLSSDVAVCCLGITNGDEFAVVVSHDCDITNAVITEGAMKEPFVEAIIARAVDLMDGNCSQAKNSRLLHIEFARNNQSCFMELVATEKRTIGKIALVNSAPDSSFSLSDSNRQILQRWLAARYRRHAFPDTLNHRLGLAFDKKLKQSADEIMAVFINYEPRNKELPENEPYELWVYVVADTTKWENIEKAEAVTQKLKEGLDKLKGLDIVECKAVADTEFTLADTRRTIEFRLEHLSLRREPFGAIAEH